MARPVRIAVAQYEPRVGDRDGNRARAERWLQEATRRRAQLVVLPELASSGYVFSSEDEAAASAEPLDGAFVSALQAACVQSGCVVVAGLNELDGTRRHNSAVIVGPRGLLAVYRKLHLFNDEKSWFAPGDELVVAETPAGMVGVVICYDLRFPEATRALALAGAEIIAVPTNWVASFKRTVWDDRGYVQANYVAMATAGQSGVVVACADRVGVERDVRFIGASIIVGPDGWPVAGPASRGGDELLIADVDLDQNEQQRMSTPRNHLITDRRPDAYRVHVRRGAASIA
ncbi:MAG: nitrilase-related carbon-nitrogen hydrolase [Candidatus Dormibacteria bacterium]